jgi:parvulin-like peptidyl-prolyl isomerase
MNRSISGTAFALALCAIVHSAAAADDPVLLQSNKLAVTSSDYQSELQRLPSDMRDPFATSMPRILKLLNKIFVERSLAEDARAAGLDKDPATQKLLAMQLDKFLAELRVEQLTKQWGQEFDKRAAQNEARAKELYEVNKAQPEYQTPEEVHAWHILLKTEKRSKADALKTAQTVRTRALAGENFGKLADEFSEDQTVQTNHGDLGFFPAKGMDPAFAKAAFALKTKGEISEPVLSSFGYHIIRYEERKPARARTFEELKEALIAQERDKYIKDKKAEALMAITQDPSIQVNEAAIEKLKISLAPETAK